MGKRFSVVKGQRFGKLEVIKEVEHCRLPCGSTCRQVLCKCDCGNTLITKLCYLLNGDTKSCGCIFKPHGCSVKNHPYHCIWSTWGSMCNRASGHIHKHNPHYSHVDLCAEWRDFKNFLMWSLENGWKKGLTIDRIDNSRGYSPDNCRWVDIATQNRNKTTIRYCDGKPLWMWWEQGDSRKVNYSTFFARVVHHGWEIEEALYTPLNSIRHFTR